MGLILLVLLIAVPLVEIAIFIEIGDVVGLWPTLALTVATAGAGVGAHRPGGRALLLGRRQGFRIAAMQADPASVLPGSADAGKGQLQRAGGWMEAQRRRTQLLDQQPADAEPERIATGQHHR